MALASSDASPPPDPVNAWQYPHWPQKQPWQESGQDQRVAKTVSNGLPGPIDPQNWENPDHMTWDDYVKPPGTNWADPKVLGSQRTFKGAHQPVRLILGHLEVDERPGERLPGVDVADVGA